MKINPRKELQNIAINHSTDIDYKGFMKIYRELIQHYQRVILYDLETTCFLLIKMTVTDQIKFLDRKIIQNEAQYDLDSKAAKISALSSKILGKYEYLTGEDLALKPSTVEQGKFEYSPLSETFIKELDKDEDKEEGLFKILKNIEGKIKGENKDQLEPIKNEKQSEASKDQSTIADNKSEKIVPLKDRLDYIFKNFGSSFINTGKNVLKKLAKDEKNIDYNNLFFNIDNKSVVKSVDFLKRSWYIA